MQFDGQKLRTFSRAHQLLGFALDGAFRRRGAAGASGLALIALLALATGCSRNIGDACTLSTDCSVTGDRLCDTTQPGGYCTQFNCEPNSCPSDSVCVLFTENTCSSPAQSDRFRRTFCLATCDSDDDCRADYRCLEMTEQPGRRVVDIDPSSTKTCAVPQVGVPVATAEPAVCRAVDAGALSSITTIDGAANDAGGDADSEGASRTDGNLDSAADVTSDSATDVANDVALRPDASPDGQLFDAPSAIDASVDAVMVDGADAAIDAQPQVDAPLDAADVSAQTDAADGGTDASSAD